MSDPTNAQPTLQDVLDAVNESSINTEGRLQKLEAGLQKLEAGLQSVKTELKDYMDVKMADLKGDLVLLMRKEDTKLKALVDVLHQKKVISEADAKHILGMDPFPQLAL